MARYDFLDLKKANEPYLDELREAALRVIDSGRYIGGKEVEELETEIGEMMHAPYVVGVSNGLDALRLTLRAWIINGRLNQGDEVIVTANTYIASVLAITDAGLRPRLVEPDSHTLNLDTSRLEAALTPSTRAVMPVHLYGRVCWDETLRDFVKEHELLVIEDAAQSIGARATVAGLYGSDRSSALGDAGCLSFYPTKNIGALGDAGAVVTHDAETAATVRALANYGSDRRYHNICQGFNCRLDPIQAAMIRVKLRHTDEENADRFARALAYEREITNPAVIKPAISRHVVDQCWHQYVVRVPADRRDYFRSELLDRGVVTDIHYAVPPHRQPCYADTLGKQSYPVTEQLASEIVSLPVGPGTSVADAAEIGRIINAISL